MNTKSNVKLFERAFHFADKSEKGYLDGHAVKVAYLCIYGYKPSKQELTDLLDSYGKEIKINEKENLKKEKVIYKQDFLNIINNRINFQDKDDEIREIFQCFDQNSKGFLDIEDFIHAYHLKFKHLNEIKAAQYFREIDTDNDGRISYRDFQLMMRSKDFL